MVKLKRMLLLSLGIGAIYMISTIMKLFQYDFHIVYSTSSQHEDLRKTFGDPGQHYGVVQTLVDNTSVVYVGYYDDREEQAVVKIISIFNQKKKIYKFTCSVNYPGNHVTKVTASVRLLTWRAWSNMATRPFREAFIICPVSRKQGQPSFVLLSIEGTDQPITNVTVKPPAKKNNKLTRCLQSFIKLYDNVQQLIWNIEFFKLLGVDKQIFYLENQTQRIVDVLKAYEEEGIVELRSFSVAGLPVQNYSTQFTVFQDCLLSEMNTAKYITFIDVDEIVFPRVHDTIVDMADFLFQEVGKGKRIGSLRFKLAYFPKDMGITKASYPDKDTAEKYKIDPLLHTERYKTMHAGAGPKSLVKPRTVDTMFIHYVEQYMAGWNDMYVDDDIAVLNHYRHGLKSYLEPPCFTNKEIYRFSSDLISAVKDRFEKHMSWQ